MFWCSWTELTTTYVTGCKWADFFFFLLFLKKKNHKKENSTCQPCYFWTDIETGRCQINRGSLPPCLLDWAFSAEYDLSQTDASWWKCTGKALCFWSVTAEGSTWIDPALLPHGIPLRADHCPGPLVRSRTTELTAGSIFDSKRCSRPGWMVRILAGWKTAPECQKKKKINWCQKSSCILFEW